MEKKKEKIVTYMETDREFGERVGKLNEKEETETTNKHFEVMNPPKPITDKQKQMIRENKKSKPVSTWNYEVGDYLLIDRATETVQAVSGNSDFYTKYIQAPDNHYYIARVQGLMGGSNE